MRGALAIVALLLLVPSAARASTVHVGSCGPLIDNAGNPEPGELIPRSCDRVDYLFGLFSEDELLLFPNPTATTRHAAWFSVRCPEFANSDASFTPCTPRIELRRGFGHGRLLRTGARNITPAS